ncbi:NACHT domain- and WD repeat-containing protein 1-like [Acanthaster planci]|uniref:NACHT domain- and WD repeat-containing protein 1-like n=1 Tax=Acanthaster planci TaxID=133434 RepID=A0A8B7XQ34_ACAPL|nr:NACHT domain- and WD repeat-containing protein 1-like [Acanthaster planci]
MGNGAVTMGQTGLALPVPSKSRYKSWQKFGNIRATHMAVLRMQGGQAGHLWKNSRGEREPWKTLLLQAQETLEEERSQARQGGAGAGAGGMDYRSVMQGEAAWPHLKRNAREVWVFISSTFTDMKLERNLLMEDVYPFVREYARLIGLSFNPVDMRWGIRQTVCDAHQASEICLDEVERCRENSVGPFFVCILGQKYGYRPIPYRVSQSVFEPIIGYIERQAETDSSKVEALRLLKEWFRLDTNSVDCEYVMQPIVWKFPKHNEDARQRDGWWAEFCTMRMAFFAAVKQVVQDPSLRQEILRSITEGEIAKAIQGSHPAGHCRFQFFRRAFAGFSLRAEGASGYVDWDGGRVDAEAAMKLDNLSESIANTVSSDRIEKYSLHFLPTAEAMFKDDRNKDHLRNFLDQFCHYLVKSVHQGALSLASALDDSLYTEVISHSIFCRERADFFAGRERLIGSLMAYLKRPHGERPFVVHGCGGSGKSSLLAKVISRSLESWKGCEIGRPVHLMRFIASTPHSSNIRDLLYFICLQLSYCLNLDQDSVPTEYRLLEAKFHDLLGRATAEKPFMIFLDSLDQLSNENEGRDLHWLRSVLPKHVHLIVTIRPNAGGALSAMKNLVKHEESYLEVLRLDEQDQNSLIDMMLNKAGRRLQPDQKSLVLNAHHDNDPTPLFTRLACDIAMRWRSYTPMEECRLADSTPGLIRQLFKQLEVKHGEIFVRHALGYLTASTSGLSASELIDVLSCDDVVLDDVFQYHIPPIRRLPPLLWTRLRLDLGDYLVEGGVDNSVVYRWYHRLFYETARQMYLGESGPLLHQALAMYFLGRWADTPKPYTEKDSGKLAVAHRRVQSQPLILNSASACQQRSFTDVSSTTKPKTIHWNLRKLTELPRHLVRGNLWEECEMEMCSIPWVEAKCRTGRIYKLLLELAESADKSESVNTKLKDFYRMVRSNVSIIQRHPELICQQALNEPDSSTCSAVAKEYLAVRGKHMFTWLDLSKDQNKRAEIMTLTHTAPVRLCQFSVNCKYLATACTDRTVRVWRVASGALEVTAEADPIKMAFPTHCHWLAVLEKTGINFLGLGQGGHAKGKFVLQIPTELEQQVSVCIPKTNRHIYVVAFGRLNVYSTNDGKLVQKKELKCRPKAVSFASGGKLLAIANKDVFLWDMAKETDTKHFETQNLKAQLNSCNLQFSGDGKRLMGVLPNGTYRWAVRGNNTKAQGHKLSLTCQTGSSAISKNLDFVASLCGENDLRVLRLQPTVEWCLLQGHQGPVLAADFGETQNEDQLLATGSQDCSVRIWDTASITKHITVQDENHSGAVDGCVYSDDGRLAVSSSPSEDHLVWSVTTTPPKVTHHLQSIESCKPGEVLCISANFVVGSCNGNDFDIWNLKSPPLRTDNMVIKGIHRLLPYVNPHLTFTVFRQALLSCFTTSNRPGILYLYEVLPAAALRDWLQNPDILPPVQAYAQDVKEFKHGANFLVPAATLNSECSRLVTLTVKMTSEQMMASTIRFDKLEYHHGSPELLVWDVQRQNVLRKHQLENSVGRFHQLGVLADKCIMFYQRKVSGATLKTNGHRLGDEVTEAVVQVFGSGSEPLLKTICIQGAYNKMVMPADGYINPRQPLDKQLESILLNCIGPEGILTTSKVGTGQPVGKFMLQVAKVTCYTFSPDNQTAMVGFDSGHVHFLRMYNAVGKNYYK